MVQKSKSPGLAHRSWIVYNKDSFQCICLQEDKSSILHKNETQNLCKKVG